MALRSRLTPQRLRGLFASFPAVSVTLHLPNSAWLQAQRSPSRLMSALAGSAATLTAPHGLPLVKLEDSAADGLAASHACAS